MDRPKMSDYDDILNIPLEKWSFITDNITTNSSSPLSPITTQSVLNQFPPTVTTSNEPTNTTTTTHSDNINKTNQKVSSVRANPTISGQGLVKKVERNIIPFTSTQHNIAAKLQRTNTKPPLRLDSLVKETSEFMSNAYAGSKNEYSILAKKYDELKLENAKLHDELNHLKHHKVTLVAKIDALTPPETRQTNAQWHNNEQIVTNDTNPDQLYNLVETGQIVDSEHSQALSDTTEMQIKQLPDDDSLSNQASDISDQLKSISNSVFQCIATVCEHASPSVSGQIDVINKLTNERSHQQVIGANVDQKTTQMHQSNGSQANTNKVVNAEDGLVNQNEHSAHLNDEDNISDNEHSIVESNKPSTIDLQPRSNRIASTQPTGSNRRNLTKHKQTQSTRSVKRSKKTIENEDGEKEEDMATEDGVDDKLKVLHLNCTEQNCEVKLNSLEQLYQHLRTLHRLLPLRCFALNCNVRCDNARQIGIHLKSQHSNATKFECHICHKEFGSQKKAFNHWYQCHLTGQFECNLSECYQVLDTRTQVHTHQLHKHCAQSERFNCPHDDCEASFATKSNLERHEMIHLNNNPFRCGWPHAGQCNYRSNRRAHVVRHIRTQHFGLPVTVKQQNAKNIVDNRDPNEFVFVVEQ